MSNSPKLRPAFHSGNLKFAFQAHYHIGIRTRKNAKVLGHADRADKLHQILSKVCQRSNFRILQTESNTNWLRLLLSLRPNDAPSKTVQTIKANTSRMMFDAFPELERQIGRRALWSRGYFVRSVGDVPDQVISEYLAKQKAHHASEWDDSVFLAEYADHNPKRFFELRPFSHCMAEYNCHFVCCPVRHVGAIDPIHASRLAAYIRQVATVRRFELIRLAVLSDHLHVFAALRPNQAPAYLAETIMNNTTHWFRQNNPGVFKVWNIPGFWTCSAFLRTAGAVTTNHIRAFLQSGG